MKTEEPAQTGNQRWTKLFLPLSEITKQVFINDRMKVASDMNSSKETHPSRILHVFILTSPPSDRLAPLPHRGQRLPGHERHVGGHRRSVPPHLVHPPPRPPTRRAQSVSSIPRHKYRMTSVLWDYILWTSILKFRYAT